MFCVNCGKEIIGNTRFCQFCGSEQNAVVIPGASIPVSPISGPSDTANIPNVSSTPTVSTPAPGISIEPPVTSMGVLSGNSAPVNTNSAEPSGSASLPTPNAIPTGNIGTAETAVYSAPLTAAAPSETVTEIAIKDEEKRPPERKYSLKHIVMCLAAAAVMAVTAGVFAGLYFSVIMA